MAILFIFILVSLTLVNCQTDSDNYVGSTGNCKDMLQGFINGQLASALGSLQLENLRKEFQRSLDDKDSEIKELRRETESLKTTIEEGFAGGSYFTNKGAAAEPLCLPPDPEWGLHTESADNTRGYVYGAEYEFSTLTDSRKNLHEHDVPCAVCRVKQRSVVITIPARKSCYPGWYQEYTGYLVAGYHGHEAATQYTCIDVNPIGIPNSQGDQNGKLFYPVESRCGSLPCPPYVNGRELTCVVCSI
ncbi:hypothetical protein FSP39_014501 [Pinctada imbricata]|uniref:Short-chain collagen C4-like n=1 Tax=Pinctada imbricata TaxID=66713 RepID=A0AA88YMN1_PINIB|nr:hypothetical protein FSP39_014501 [Pinctada imbricata]